ncbi:MAG TPA: tetratricopeptide repeat protein [Candidatus Limnocylindrales bacterium]|nr:tetratricopeptide repeat protein [Candidatus Limnocylindrales bacterium]
MKSIKLSTAITPGLIVFLLFAVLPTAAGIPAQQTTTVQVIVRVYIDSYQNPAGTNITVQLLDGFGTLEREAHTDNSGRVEFQTQTITKAMQQGGKRVRIFGPGIQEYNETLEIEPVEIRKNVNVVVRSNPAGGTAAGVPSDLSSVAANRLKVPGKAEKEFLKGKDAGEKKDWAEATKHYQAAIALYPDYDLAYNGLGQALASGGDNGGARSAFEKAIQINDNFAAAYRNLARISLSEHKFEEMDNLLTRSLSAEPLNAWALAYAAYAELQLHKFDDAIAHARKAHSVKHDGLASIHIVAGRALEEKQRPSEALEEYRLYLQEDGTGRDAERAREAVTRLSTSSPG